MQLEFAQAMSDFKTMFPNMDRDVIEAVLRSNLGAVDATIDQLLAMSIDNQVKMLLSKFCVWPVEPILLNAVPFLQNETLRNELDIPENGQPREQTLLTSSSPAANVKPDICVGISPKTASHSNENGEGPSMIALATGTISKSKKWNPPILGPLPAGFLRLSSADVSINGQFYRSSLFL